MWDLLYWNTQLMLFIGELAIILLGVVLPPLWVAGAIVEAIYKFKIRRKLQLFNNNFNNVIEEYRFIDKDKRKDK